jgi:hypothetical protein
MVGNTHPLLYSATGVPSAETGVERVRDILFGNVLQQRVTDMGYGEP